MTSYIIPCKCACSPFPPSFYPPVQAEPSIVTKLDLTNSLVAAATNRVHTEMMEACCLAVVQVCLGAQNV
jgi:hypothetical protein